MKKGITSSILVLLSFGLSLSCASVTPVPPSAGSSPSITSSASTRVSPQASSVIKPVHPPVIWWGPKPDTPERFLNDMKHYYPDWHKWFADHPEDIGNYFSSPPPPPDSGASGVPVSGPIPESAKAAMIFDFSGRVSKVDEAAGTIEVSRKRMSMIFILNDQTKITQAESGVVLNDVKEGMNVFVEFKIEDNKMIATAIKVTPPETAPVVIPPKRSKELLKR